MIDLQRAFRYIVYFVQRADGDIRIGSCSFWLWPAHLKRITLENQTFLAHFESKINLLHDLRREFKRFRRYSLRGSTPHPTAWFAPSETILRYIASKATFALPVLPEFPPSLRVEEGLVYFAVQRKGMKIGFTSNIERRMYELGKQYPGIMFLGFLPGTYDDEFAYQKRFSHWNIKSKNGIRRTDWFLHNAVLLDFILRDTYSSVDDALSGDESLKGRYYDEIKKGERRE